VHAIKSPERAAQRFAVWCGDGSGGRPASEAAAAAAAAVVVRKLCAEARVLITHAAGAPAHPLSVENADTVCRAQRI